MFSGGDHVVCVEIGTAEGVGEAGQHTRATIEAFDGRTVRARSSFHPLDPTVVSAIDDLQPSGCERVTRACDFVEQVREMAIQGEPSRLVHESGSGAECQHAHRSAAPMGIGQIGSHASDP